MAKVITELPKKAGGIGREPKYPYDTWLDGQIWQLDVGDDFEGKPQSMRANINNAAKKKGLKVRSRIVETGLVIQSYKPTNGKK